MLSAYCEGDMQKNIEYDSLLFMIEQFNTVIDIWNHPFDKKIKRDPNESLYECIDSMNHKYIKFLEMLMNIINFWKAKCTIGKK